MLVFHIVVTEWLTEKELPIAFEDAADEVLAGYLSKFYAGLQSKGGMDYSKSSVLSIRSSLQRHLSFPPCSRAINIVSGITFKRANNVIRAIIREMKRKGSSLSKLHEPITPEDLKRMYTSEALSQKDPTSLLHKVYFEMALHFGMFGRERFREVEQQHIQFRVDGNGVEYAQLMLNPLEKDQGIPKKKSEYDLRMYGTGQDSCPLASLKYYISKLHPKCKAFFQRPKTTDFENAHIWYISDPVGVHTIGKFMESISKRAQLSYVYSNRCIKATAVTTLRDGRIKIPGLMNS